jgi:hypothetical protein
MGDGRWEMGEGGKPAACSTGEEGRSRFSRAERRVVKSWWVGPGGRWIAALRRRGSGRRMGKVSSRGKRSGVR